MLFLRKRFLLILYLRYDLTDYGKDREILKNKIFLKYVNCVGRTFCLFGNLFIKIYAAD